MQKRNIKEVLNKSKTTLLKKYGEDSPLKIKQFKEKFETTCLDRFGETHPSKNIQISQRIKDANIETYKDPNLRKEIGEKITKAYKEGLDSIIEKRKNTNFKKTGEYTTLTSSAINNAKQMLFIKYNTSNPFNVHKDTYELAKLGSLKFYSNIENKKSAINKRVKTIISKYGSLEQMNAIVFENKKYKILDELKQFGVKDEIIEYAYNNLGNVKCICNKCKNEYSISLQLLRDRTLRNDTTCVLCSPPEVWRSNAEIELYN